MWDADDDGVRGVKAPNHSRLSLVENELHGSTTTSTCMLGLRPRLKTRPSLLDLIHSKNIDQISASVEKVVPALEAHVEPFRVPLPASPLISPQRQDPPQLPPPRITLQEDSDEDAVREEAVKMPPVSFVDRP